MLICRIQFRTNKLLIFMPRTLRVTTLDRCGGVIFSLCAIMLTERCTLRKRRSGMNSKAEYWKSLDIADFFFDRPALLNHAEMLRCANILVRSPRNAYL
jgi:hypothetical protein